MVLYKATQHISGSLKESSIFPILLHSLPSIYIWPMSWPGAAMLIRTMTIYGMCTLKQVQFLMPIPCSRAPLQGCPSCVEQIPKSSLCPSRPSSLPLTSHVSSIKPPSSTSGGRQTLRCPPDNPHFVWPPPLQCGRDLWLTCDQWNTAKGKGSYSYDYSI